MKKLLAIFLVVSVLFSLASCGGNETESNKNNNDVVENDDNNQQNVGNSDNAGNKTELPAELTVEFVRNYPETDASLFKVEQVDGGVMVGPYIGNDEIVVIPEEIDGQPVVAVKRRAFLNNNNIRAVKLADTVKVIGEESFLCCGKLEVFICGRGLETIEEYAIGSCVLLKNLELNDGLKTIGQFSITKGSMEGLYIPSSVTEMHSSFGDDGLKIICEAGSVAEQHAIQNGYTYEIR